MKNVENLSIDLSTEDDEVQANANKNEHKTVYDLPEDQGKLEGVFFSTSNDIVLYRGEYEFDADVIGPEYNFGNVKGKFAEETLLINTTLGGWQKQIDYEIGSQSDHVKGSYLFGQEHTNFGVIQEFEQDNIFQTSKKVVNAVLTIPISSLRLLIGSETTEKLRQFLNIENTPSFKVHKIPKRITQILHAAINPRLTGSMKQLYCQSKSLEYLCELVELMEKMEEKSLRFDEKRSLIIDVYDNLVDQDGKIPTLAQLAEQYDIPARRLNAQFQKEYGMTINQYATKLRLNEAYVSVEEGDLPLKEIAARIGYSHVNHFTTAFKREFGFPPGSLRKK